MNEVKKLRGAYKTIGEVSKELGLIDKKNGNLKTYTIRYWETHFKQIKPLVKAGKRRYYSEKDIQIIKKIKFLLKEKGLTIDGVKKILVNNKSDLLDDNVGLGIYKGNFKNTDNFKRRLIKISNIIKEIKKLKNG